MSDLASQADELESMRSAPANSLASQADELQSLRGNIGTTESPSNGDSIGAKLRDVGAGAIRGAGSIGATLLWPMDKLADIYSGQTGHNAGRRAAMDAGLTTLTGSNPNSFSYKAGKLGGEIAGTAGVGSALGTAAAALGASPVITSALTTGGMSLGGGTVGSTAGNIALRGAAGAAVGGASAGMVNPSDAGAGAAIGALTPGAAWLLGMAGKGAANAVGYATKNVLGATTGTGSAAVDAAWKSGLSGDRTFLDNMRGNSNFSDIVDQAKDALATMRDARGQAYRNGMAAVSGDKTVLDIQPILSSVQQAQQKFATFNGQVVNENAHAAIEKVADKMATWASQDPAIFRTPEGLDKLKQWVGGELENVRPGTQTDAALKGIYNSIKSAITKQAPTYAKTMSDYEAASQELSEISRTLSINPKASIDTSVRKLQSILRNNVNTNFGARAGAVDALEQKGGASLVPAIAGQSMNSVWPRGVAGAIDAAAAIPAAIHNPLLLTAGIAASPRTVGEAAYAAGRMASPIAWAASRPGAYIPLNAVAPVLGTQQPVSLNQILNQVNGERR